MLPHAYCPGGLCTLTTTLRHRLTSVRVARGGSGRPMTVVRACCVACHRPRASCVRRSQRGHRSGSRGSTCTQPQPSAACHARMPGFLLSRKCPTPHIIAADAWHMRSSLRGHGMPPPELWRAQPPKNALSLTAVQKNPTASRSAQRRPQGAGVSGHHHDSTRRQ